MLPAENPRCPVWRDHFLQNCLCDCQLLPSTANFTNSNCAGSWLSKMLWRPQQNHKQHTSAFLNYQMILKKLEKCFFFSDFNFIHTTDILWKKQAIAFKLQNVKKYTLQHFDFKIHYLCIWVHYMDPKVFIISPVLQSFSLHVSTMNLVQVSLCHSYESQNIL